VPDDSPIAGGDAGQATEDGQSFPRRMGKKGGPANGLSCLNPATTQATCQRFPGLARMLAVHRASQWLSDCMAGMHIARTAARVLSVGEAATLAMGRGARGTPDRGASQSVVAGGEARGEAPAPAAAGYLAS